MNRDTQKKPRSWSLTISLLLAPVFAALIIWQWPIVSSKILDTKQIIETFFADIDALGERSRALMVEVEETKQITTDRVNQFDAHIAESKKLQEAIESPRKTSSHDTDESLLDEIEQLILYTNQHLSLTTDINIALKSLHKAEALLAQANNAQLSALHDSILENIKDLETVPDANTDTETMNISRQLKNLAATIDELPLQANANLKEIELGLIPKQIATKENLWLKFLNEIWEDVKGFIHIQKTSDPNTEILSPSQIHFLSESLKLKFVLMRFSLLSHDKTDFNTDLETTINWINRHYDKNSELVIDMLNKLNQLHDDNAGLKKPDISATLDEINKFRNMRNEENK